jgi:preprotein translocase subunit SecD
MRANMGPTEKKIRIAAGAAATAVAIFVPLRYKWKGLLSAAAFTGLFTGTTGFSPVKKVLGLGH